MALFGTDGVRGVANEALTPTLAMDLGRAAGSMLGPGRRVVIGRDTRVSGFMLESAAAAGLASAGVETVSIGVAPTPAVAALVPILHADAGLVISASHNPPEYNGLKLLARDGRKWTPQQEGEVERRMGARDFHSAAPTRVGRWLQWPEALDQYRRQVVGRFAGSVPALHAVLDIGHGAASMTAASVLEALGITCDVLYGEPHGLLINRNCGATHPEVVARAVRDRGADIGLAFDGDADRLMAVDDQGQVLDGDGILYVLARGFKAVDELAGDRVVATVMSNLGLERGLAASGIVLDRTAVGDRWVAERMAETGAVLGGEQSGHIILAKWAVTGDGLLTALQLLAEMGRTGKTLAALRQGFDRYPQVLKNVHLTKIGEGWQEWPGMRETLQACEQELGGEGRVFVRTSGTEPLLRIMLEGRDVDHITLWADRLVAVVEQALESETEPSPSRP
ncbi:MAG: phosphoglucosamine mutase [Gemmataceae bacterium]